MKTLTAWLFTAAIVHAQIAVTSSPQSVTLESPTPITCVGPQTQLTCSAPVLPTVITLPIEVCLGETIVVPFVIPATASLPATPALSLRVHNVKYDTEASLRVNSSTYAPISAATVTILGLGANFGGIGGGYSTLDMTIPAPGPLAAGPNTIAFRFNGTDGVSSCFRVLAVNVLDSSGSPILPASTFVWDDPEKWTPPLNTPADIAAGKAAFQAENSLHSQMVRPGTSATMIAACSDCHTSDGRDLKYFNYSNHEIANRAVFHGLTPQQGAQIASYIRSLTTPSPGRPWNPPYQPGPGMDSQPVANWAAGAGLAAVLATDAAMQPYLMPGGSTAGWAATAYLNPREIPLELQLPDWNSWLPIVHPIDGFGATFTTAALNTNLPLIVKALQSSANPATAYKNALGAFQNWYTSGAAFTRIAPPPPTMTPAQRQQFYSLGLWGIVKTWELNQTYGLEALASVPFGAKANPRGWYGTNAFDTAPNMQKITVGPGMANGTAVARDYLSLAWYQVQLILNDGQGTQSQHNPMDFGYVSGFIRQTFQIDQLPNPQPAANLMMFVGIKCLQEFTLTGIGPEKGINGWQPTFTPMGMNVNFNYTPLWTGTPPATMAAMLTGAAEAFFAQAQQYTPAQYYAGGWASATEDPAASQYSTTFGGIMWYTLPRLRFAGVSATLTTQMAAWAATIWPKGNWALNNAATCTSYSVCTSGL